MGAIRTASVLARSTKSTRKQYRGSAWFGVRNSAPLAHWKQHRWCKKAVLDSLESIVPDESRAAEGRPSFQQILTPDDMKAIRAYIIARAQRSAKPLSSRPAH